MWCLTRRRPPASPSRAWESRRIRWKRSSRNISGASARPGSSHTGARDPGFVGWAKPTGRANACPPSSHQYEIGAVGTAQRAPLPTLRSTRALSSHRQRDQAERADDDAPPCEQYESVAGDVSQECLDHDHRGDERHHESDRDDARVIEADVGAILVEFIDEGADHGRDRQEERKLRRRALV